MTLKFSMDHFLSFHTDFESDWPFSKLMGLWYMVPCLPNHCPRGNEKGSENQNGACNHGYIVIVSPAKHSSTRDNFCMRLSVGPSICVFVCRVIKLPS